MGFEDFLRQEKDKRKDKPTPANFDRLVREWQLEVKNLHDQIEKWLAAEIEQELLDILRGKRLSHKPPRAEFRRDLFRCKARVRDLSRRLSSRFRNAADE